MNTVYLKIKEVSDFIRIKSSTIHQKIRTDKDFPRPCKVGNLLLFKKSELEEYMEKKRIK